MPKGKGYGPGKDRLPPQKPSAEPARAGEFRPSEGAKPSPSDKSMKGMK